MSTLSSEAEEGCLQRLRDGDDEATERFVRTHIARVRAVVRRILKDSADVDDVVQVAFMKALRALPDFEGRSKLSTWLHRIAVNAALSHLRRLPKVSSTPIDELLPRFDHTSHHVERFREWTLPAATIAERRERNAVLRERIQELPDGHREILLLRDVEGFSTREAAQSLGITENAAKVRLHRARQALRTLIQTSMQEGSL